MDSLSIRAIDRCNGGNTAVRLSAAKKVSSTSGSVLFLVRKMDLEDENNLRNIIWTYRALIQRLVYVMKTTVRDQRRVQGRFGWDRRKTECYEPPREIITRCRGIKHPVSVDTATVYLSSGPLSEKHSAPLGNLLLDIKYSIFPNTMQRATLATLYLECVSGQQNSSCSMHVMGCPSQAFTCSALSH